MVIAIGNPLFDGFNTPEFPNPKYPKNIGIVGMGNSPLGVVDAFV